MTFEGFTIGVKMLQTGPNKTSISTLYYDIKFIYLTLMYHI